MIKCPNCNKEMEDGAKFCSECAFPLPSAPEKTAEMNESAPEADAIDTAEIVPEAESPTVIEELATTEKPVVADVAEEPKKRRRSRKGVFISMLLAVLAVVLMYVFYGELGFDTNQKSENNVVLYVADGELAYTDPAGQTQVITKDLGGALSDLTELGKLVKLSADGKTVFYPDRTGADGKGYSLYCMEVENDMLPIKLGNDIVSYGISPDGKTVCYLTYDGTLYRHDLKTKTKLDHGVTALYTASGYEYLYYRTEKGIYYCDFAACEKIGNESVQILTYGAGMLVCRDGDTTYLVSGKSGQKLDLGENATDVRISPNGDSLYYCESVGENLYDLYRVYLKEGKVESTLLWEADMIGYAVTESGALCLKDVDAESGLGDLYINGVCLGYDATLDKIASCGNKIAFLADCDRNGNGTLTLYEGKKAMSVRGDVTEFGFTSAGTLVFLCDVAKDSQTGDLYRYGEKTKLIANDVSTIVTPE